MEIDIKVIGDHIWFNGQAVAQLRVPEGTLRSSFLSIIDSDALRETIEEEKQFAYDTGYEEGHDEGYEEGYSQGLAEGKNEE